MTIASHPFVLNRVAQQRQAEVLARVDRERQARQVPDHCSPERLWPNFSAAPVATVLALLLTLARLR